MFHTMRDKTKSYIFVALISLLVLLPVAIVLLVLSEDRGFLPDVEDKTWVQTDPTQCMTNPWEEDWLESNNYDYSSYPKDVHTPGLEQEEVEIIKSYYQRQGITVFDVKSKQTHEVVCAACFCPEGYTLYLLISDSDVPTMLQWGYEIS